MTSTANRHGTKRSSDLYRNLRNGEPPNAETAQKFFEKLFFSPKKYDLGRVGRYRMNKKFNLDIPLDNTVITPEDFVMIVEQLISMRRVKKHRTISIISATEG
ncbi:MAG: hypothetical protein U5N26_10420 [Candidatus Marinimicrobia bacterium]|nr:hypothetical protein [Candidatus Neomarinimicrobiota bacterium]